MDRVEEIRERVEKLRASPTLQIAAGHVHPDYTYLLERIDELEREKRERKEHYASGAGDCWMRLKELERENERLKRTKSNLRDEIAGLRAALPSDRW